MKNKKFWITSAVLAVVIIIVVLIVRFGGKKVRVKSDGEKTNNVIWIFGLDDKKEVVLQEYTTVGTLLSVITPYSYEEITATDKGTILTAIPIKALVWRDPSGKTTRTYLKKGSYINKEWLYI